MNNKQFISRSETLAAMALFALLGLELIFNELPFEWPPPNWAHLVNRLLFVGILILPPIGLCIGWIKSFPRWSYPYVAHVLFFSLYMTNVATPGFLFDRELWGWRAWIPFAVVVVISLLITRSLRPLRKFFTNIKEDWTLLTFGLFGSMPLLIMLSFDEVDRLFSLYFMVILTLLMMVTVFIYMQRPAHRERVAGLLIGILLTITLTMAAPTIYWHNHGDTSIIATVVAGMIVFLVLFSPALISLLPRSKRRISQAQ